MAKPKRTKMEGAQTDQVNTRCAKTNSSRLTKLMLPMPAETVTAPESRLNWSGRKGPADKQHKSRPQPAFSGTNRTPRAPTLNLTGPTVSWLRAGQSQSDPAPDTLTSAAHAS
ncbi:hypothetical protein N7462_001641 [Penicillium macrosclerotiorum]|uniref:uncharacterized protein n=1 Tax=Penicillium macrosclerotiorum TaxID=303699 RepID=UPI0025497C91|nr:uncharacterized protein N7462_001641 [Penicillium macrosclerotiorum]KAJ5692218.1 hypothetical protein N7462_001641 [Penicillium macrosclerotiorum]